MIVRPHINSSAHVAYQLAYQGWQDLEKNDNEKAASRFQQAVDRLPSIPDWWFNLGIAYYRLERYPEAVNAYECATTLDPKNPDYQDTLSQLRCLDRRAEGCESLAVTVASRSKLHPQFTPRYRDVQSPPGKRISWARAGPPGSLPKSTKNSSLIVRPPRRVAVDLQQVRARLGHLGIELVVPTAVERIGDVQPPAVEAELQHLRAAGEFAPARPAALCPARRRTTPGRRAAGARDR